MNSKRLIYIATSKKYKVYTMIIGILPIVWVWCSILLKIGTRSVHVGSHKKDQLTKLVICDITLNALFFPFMFAPPANLTFREF